MTGDGNTQFSAGPAPPNPSLFAMAYPLEKVLPRELNVLYDKVSDVPRDQLSGPLITVRVQPVGGNVTVLKS